MALTHVPARNEVDTRYTWNDTSVFATVDEWAAELEALLAAGIIARPTPALYRVEPAVYRFISRLSPAPATP